MKPSLNEYLEESEARKFYTEKELATIPFQIDLDRSGKLVKFFRKPPENTPQIKEAIVKTMASSFPVKDLEATKKEFIDFQKNNKILFFSEEHKKRSFFPIRPNPKQLLL